MTRLVSTCILCVQPSHPHLVEPTTENSICCTTCSSLRAVDLPEPQGYIKGIVKDMIHNSSGAAPLAKLVFRDAAEGIHMGRKFVHCGNKARLSTGNALPSPKPGDQDDPSEATFRLKVISSANRAVVGVVAGGGRADQPILKAGRAYHTYKAKRNCWPHVRVVAMNPVEPPFGGDDHQHIGKPCTIRRDAGGKVGFIAASGDGRLSNTKTVQEKEN
ncbi:60S ribosomal protein L8 [Tupaia chinensis]|uniref:Large ribosomal subunit protein uL2 n=1 Tax=Tupaia chinensis TaxID=246437 RepID=L9KQU2_TUPCH|nr:60S ribosomal protein L8 [Tupaia chinensis]